MIVVVLGQFRLIVGQPRVHKFSKVIAQVRLGVCVWNGVAKIKREYMELVWKASYLIQF